MKVILCEDIDKIGTAGEIKDVSEGFARNFLLPKCLAMDASASNIKRWQSEKHVREVKLQKNVESAKTLAAQIEQISLAIPAKAGREGHLFGSITNVGIAEALLTKGFSIDRKTIELAAPIKSLGEFTVLIRLHSQVQAKLKVVVEREGEAVAAGA